MIRPFLYIILTTYFVIVDITKIEEIVVNMQVYENKDAPLEIISPHCAYHLTSSM